MFDRLLVPLDGRPQSAVALYVARLLGEPSVAEITLLHVLPQASTRPNDFGAAAEYLRRISDELRVRPLTVWTALRRGAVVPEIMSAASDAGADLIVLATHVDVSLGQPRLGQTAVELTRASSCAIVLVPEAGHRPVGLQSIVVLVTGTGQAESGLGAAARLAQMVRAHLKLVLVQRPGSGTAALRLARQRVDRMAARLSRVGIEASGTALEGELPTLLAEMAETVHADLIAMRQPSAADLEQYDCDAAGVLAATRRPLLLAKA